ncbi:hypothetical protein CPB86DRAFT_699473 [Serendipita vermifera]|nr:hypothetical protein CPB86DRAFT_699473 [Serendipita vermifera]
MRERHGLDEAQIERIQFVQGNFFSRLPFLIETFDFIRIAFLELAIPETKWLPLLKEASRIVKRGGHIEVIVEFLIFPTIPSYSKIPDDSNLEEEFDQMLDNRDLVPVSHIGEKMFFDPSFRVQTHQPVSVSIAPRPGGRSTADRLMLLSKVYGERWNSKSKTNKGIVASPLDQDWSVLDALPPPGQIVACQTCLVPGVIISPDIFVPMPEDTIHTHASHGARILQSTYLAMFLDKYPNAIEGDKIAKDFEEQWKAHVTRYERFEENTRKRIGCREKQFIDEDSEIFFPNPGPNTPRWTWFTFDEKAETPLEIRRFRAWTLTKPGKYIY